MARQESQWLSDRKKAFLYNETPENYYNLFICTLRNLNNKETKSLFNFFRKNSSLKKLVSKSYIETPSDVSLPQIYANVYDILKNEVSDDIIINWAQLNIESNHTLIRDFIKKKDEFEKNRLLSNFSKCHSILHEIKCRFGYSWWLIDANISLIQEEKGKSEHIKYVKELIKQTSSRSGLFTWLVQCISEKSEEKTELTRFSSRLTNNLDSFDIPPLFNEYIQYRVLRKNNSNITSCLILDSFGSIIDVYESFVYVCVNITKTNNKIPNQLYKSIKSVIKKIESRQLQNCLIAVDETYKKKKVKEYTISEIGLDFLSGNYENAINKSLEDIKNNANNLESILILSSMKSGVIKLKNSEQYKKSMLSEVIINLHEFRLFNENSPVAYSKLRKISSNNYSLNISYVIDSILFEKPNLALIETTDYSLRFFYSDNVDVFSAPLIDDKFNNKYQSCKDISDIKKIIKYDKLNNFEQIEILTREAEFTHTEIHKQNNAYILNQRCNALLGKELFFECMNVAVNNILKNRFLLSILPIGKMIKGKRWPAIKGYKDHIELSIIIHFYLTLHEDSLQKTNLGFAWDWFRRSRNVFNISELLNDEHSDIDKDKLIYFLSEISTPEVMENHSDGLDTPESTLVTRSQILAKLIENDKSRDKFYEKEQVSLLKSISIQRGLDKLNQNKLYVDENIIKSWAQREIESSYERYQETLSNPELAIFSYNNTGDNFEDDIISFINDMITINSEECASLFRQISYEYLNNKQGGLNFFLSMRIRHGKLESTLRKPLSDNHLLTIKDDDNSSYKDNKYWVDKLKLNKTESEELNKNLIELSSLFDGIITDYKDNKIRCYSDKTPYGMFYINPKQNELVDLKRKIESGVNFDVFCNEAIKLCKRKIESTIPLIKRKIDSEITHLIINKLNTLLEFSDSKNYKELSESIKNARHQFKRTSNIVTEWFNFDDVDINQKSLTIDDCIDISLANIRNVHSDFSLTLEKKLDRIKDFKLSDIDSNNINEVFYILLDNIYKRSGLKNNVKVRIRIKKFDKDHIKITMINEIANDVDCEENKSNLKDIKNSIYNGHYQNKASDEGNSGLLKLRNMNHTQHNNCLNFGFKFKSFFISYKLKLTINKGLLQW